MSKDPRSLMQLLATAMVLLIIGSLLSTIISQRAQLTELRKHEARVLWESKASYEIAMSMMDLLGQCNADDGDGLSPRD